MLKFSDYEPFSLKGLIMEMEWFFCIANMILDSELLLRASIATRLHYLHPASSSTGVMECSKTVYRRSAFSNFFLSPNEERNELR